MQAGAATCLHFSLPQSDRRHLSTSIRPTQAGGAARTSSRQAGRTREREQQKELRAPDNRAAQSSITEVKMRYASSCAGLNGFGESRRSCTPSRICLMVMPGFQASSSFRILRHTVPDGYTLGWKKPAPNYMHEASHAIIVTQEPPPPPPNPPRPTAASCCSAAAHVFILGFLSHVVVFHKYNIKKDEQELTCRKFTFGRFVRIVLGKFHGQRV